MTTTVWNAMRWRIKHYQKEYHKCRWALKRGLDFSKKRPVDAVSLVVVGRNDNYGGDFSRRLQATLDWNMAHLPNPELIYIEWNRIKDKASDCTWITERYPTARCYIVPEEIHQKIAAFPEKMPVMEYFAKNLGIRKAASDWILMVNADVFLGNDTIKNIRKLNPDTVYATHYVSIKWDGMLIGDAHQKNKGNAVTSFAVSNHLGSAVGNFILTHKKNWMQSTGYDERLNNVRSGVDANGLDQLLGLGVKPMVIGHHYHLDHPESIIHGNNATHGTHAFDNIPYRNPEEWGLIRYPLTQISERIWELKPI